MHPVLEELRAVSTPITIKYKILQDVPRCCIQDGDICWPHSYYPHPVNEHTKCLLPKIYGKIMQSSSIRRHCKLLS